MTTILRKNQGNAKSVPGALATGGAVSILTTIIMSCLTAYLIHTEHIQWSNIGYWIMTILFLSSYLGAKTSYLSLKRQKMIISALSGILYWGILLCSTALLFGGNFNAIPETAAIIAAGSMCSGLMSRTIGKRNSKKVRKHYC